MKTKRYGLKKKIDRQKLEYGSSTRKKRMKNRKRKKERERQIYKVKGIHKVFKIRKIKII